MDKKLLHTMLKAAVEQAGGNTREGFQMLYYVSNAMFSAGWLATDDDMFALRADVREELGMW